MAEHDPLLELLARALDPGSVEPPPDRVAALRMQAAARREGPPAEAPVAPAESPVAPAPAGPAPPGPNGPVPLHRRATAPAPTELRLRRAGWLAAGAAVAAAAVVIALITVPALVGDGGRDTPVASGPVSTTRDAVTRLRAALVTRDPLTVARADADLVRLARQLPPEERALLEGEVVEAHVEAIQFLRAHRTPEVLAAVPPDPRPDQSLRAPAGTGPGPVPTTAPPAIAPAPTTVPAGAAPTTALRGPSVTITSVKPTVEGTFAVQFTARGFTPEPGSHAVRFSFDDGQAPQVWGGASPWTFPTDYAIRFTQVCGVVVDARGVEQPGSGNCVPIL